MNSILKKYLGCGLYSDYQEMMDKEKIDAVVVSTPSNSHAEIIRAAVARDLHVFTEKPFTMNAFEGREILSLIDERPVVNQVGYVNRFNEVFTEIKRLLSKKIIGEVMTFCSEMYGPTVLKDTGKSWRGKRNTGGGCMYEFASHCIDLAVFLFGAPNAVTGSVMKSIYSSGVEDFVGSTFIYDNGLTGTIQVNWSDETYRKPTNIVTILGQKGKIQADKHCYKIFLKENCPDLDLIKGWNTRYLTDIGKNVRIYVRGNEFTLQLDHFVECIEHGVNPSISSFADAFETDVIMEKIVQNSQAIQEGSLRNVFAVTESKSSNRHNSSFTQRSIGFFS
jgi:predicted dehydrogenase